MKTLDYPAPEVDAEVFVELDAPIPCQIYKRYRPEHCRTRADHDAEWEVMLECGCVWYYCMSAFRSMIQGTAHCVARVEALGSDVRPTFGAHVVPRGGTVTT